jgi:chromosome partitioning protein
MHTIVLATQKGGSGKSTLAIGLALAAVQAGHAVRLIETDSQGTLRNWHRRRDGAEPMVESIFVAGNLERRLQSLRDSGVTLTIIDTAGGISAVTASAIRQSDLCLIPTRPSVADIEAAASTLQAARAWKKPFAIVLNQAPIRGQRITNAANILGGDGALDLSGILAQPFIAMRNDHQDALSAGLAVSEYAPQSKSTDEVRSLWQWVEAKLNAGSAEHPAVGGRPASPDVAPSIFLQVPADTSPPASWSGL